MMSSGKIGGRELKQKIQRLLTQDDFGSALTTLCQLPAREVINPLFSFFYSRDELTKWRAVTASGAVVSGLAQTDMESARIVMRRLMWNLNDESGGIGWGSPEAMGEIMARHKGLAQEYAHILVSYVRKDGNYIEHESLQRGVLWGLGRLAQAYPNLLKEADTFFPPYLDSADSIVRGLAAKLCGILRLDSAWAALEKLKNDKTSILLFCNGVMNMYQINRIAGDALSRMKKVISGSPSKQHTIYPERPQVAVGAVVFKDDRVLLVRRGRAPAKGMWAIPGGSMELGETLQAAAEREIFEETGIMIRAGEPVFTFDVIERDDDGRIRFHYVIVDMLADYISGALRPGDDAVEARWVSAQALNGLNVSSRTRQFLKERFEFGR